MGKICTKFKKANISFKVKYKKQGIINYVSKVKIMNTNKLTFFSKKY